MKFTFLVLVGLLATGSGQFNTNGGLDKIGCERILNLIKETGITLDNDGSPNGSTLTKDEIFKNKFTKQAIQMYQNDCLEIQGLPTFECPVTQKLEICSHGDSECELRNLIKQEQAIWNEIANLNPKK